MPYAPPLNLAASSDQQVFETVARHLFAQGHQAKRRAFEGSNDGVCLYHAQDGSRCAVGCLVTDKFAAWADRQPNSAIDSITDLVNDDPEEIPEGLMVETDMLLGHQDLLSYLQGVHDYRGNWSSTEAMRRSLTEVSKRFDLDHAFLSTLRFKDR